MKNLGKQGLALLCFIMLLLVGCSQPGEQPAGSSQSSRSNGSIASAPQAGSGTTIGETQDTDETNPKGDPSGSGGRPTVKQPKKPTKTNPVKTTKSTGKAVTKPTSDNQHEVIRNPDDYTPSQKTIDAKKKLDFGGKTVTLAYIWEPTKKGTSTGIDLWYERVEELEKKYNVKIVEKLGSTDYAANMITTVLSGAPMGNVMMMNYNLLSWVKAGILLDLTPAMEKTGIDFTAPWYNRMSTMYSNINNKQYSFGTGSGENIDVWFYNKRIFREMKLPDPQQLVKEKKWTWAAAEEIAKKATKRDASGNVTQWGLGLQMAGLTAMNMAVANNGFLGAVNSAGKPVINMNSSKVREAFETIYRWSNTEKFVTGNLGNQAWETYHVEFTKGNMAMLAGTSSTINIIYDQDMQDDFGLVYPPMGNSASGYVSNTSLGSVGQGMRWIVPITYEKEADKYLLLMDDLYMPYDADFDSFRDGWLKKFRDVESYNIWKDMTLNDKIKVFDPILDFGLTDLTNPDLNMSTGRLVSGEITASALIDQFNDVFQSILDENYTGYAYTGVK